MLTLFDRSSPRESAAAYHAIMVWHVTLAKALSDQKGNSLTSTLLFHSFCYTAYVLYIRSIRECQKDGCLRLSHIYTRVIICDLLCLTEDENERPSDVAVGYINERRKSKKR